MIVAELSANHCGSLDTALRMIDAAAQAGADAVKLQTYTADDMTIDHDGPDFTLDSGIWKNRKLYDLYSEASTPLHWHETLFAHAKAVGLMCFSSPFSLSAVDLLKQFNPPYYKVASFEIRHVELLRKLADIGKPVIISTGVATSNDMILAAAIMRTRGTEAVFMHCVSEYPLEPHRANLMRIPFIRSLTKCDVGFSDHSLSLTLPAMATMLGATIIEKHFTLDRSNGSLDAPFSLNPQEFREMVSRIREARAASAPIVASPPLKNLHRSIYVVADVRKGDQFTDKNVRVIRPGHGEHPSKLSEVYGRIAADDVVRGTPFNFSLTRQSWRS